MEHRAEMFEVPSGSRKQRVGLVLGPALFGLTLALPLAGLAPRIAWRYSLGLAAFQETGLDRRVAFAILRLPRATRTPARVLFTTIPMLRELAGRRLTLFDRMLIAFPLALLMLLLCWVILRWRYGVGGRAFVSTWPGHSSSGSACACSFRSSACARRPVRGERWLAGRRLAGDVLRGDQRHTGPAERTSLRRPGLDAHDEQRVQGDAQIDGPA